MLKLGDRLMGVDLYYSPFYCVCQRKRRRQRGRRRRNLSQEN